MNNNVSIGLALSGGGHKGLAHAGVLQFLEEKNIRIDVISGTSAGAIVGGLYAIGKKPTEILDFSNLSNCFRGIIFRSAKQVCWMRKNLSNIWMTFSGKPNLLISPKRFTYRQRISTPDGSRHSTDTPKPRKPLPLRVPSPAYSRPCRLKAGYTVMAVF